MLRSYILGGEIHSAPSKEIQISWDAIWGNLRSQCKGYVNDRQISMGLCLSLGTVLLPFMLA